MGIQKPLEGGNRGNSGGLMDPASLSSNGQSGCSWCIEEGDEDISIIWSVE